jgi:hypothetical protein
MDDSSAAGGSAAGDGRRGSSVRQRVRAEQSYGLLFVLIILSLIATAVTSRSTVGRAVGVATQGAVLVYALWTSRSGRRALRAALVLVPIVVVVAAVLTGRRTDLVAGVVATLDAFLAMAAIAAIVRRISANPKIDRVTILGALSTYLLIGTFFAALFAAIGGFTAEPFFATTGRATSVDYLYFSYVTLTTTGYGDLAARTDLGRMFAVTEALLGQLYLVSVVALVIGNLGRERRAT